MLKKRRTDHELWFLWVATSPGRSKLSQVWCCHALLLRNTGTTPNDATFVSTPNPVAEQAPLTPYAAPPYRAISPTQYSAQPYEPTTPAPAGSPPYEAEPQNPYSVSPYAPYSSLPLTPTPPVPPPVQRPGNRIGIIVGVVVLVLILIGGGVFAFLQYSA